MNIRLQIEEVFGDKTTIILMNVQDCTPENRNDVIQAMIRTAASAFPPVPPSQTTPEFPY